MRLERVDKGEREIDREKGRKREMKKETKKKREKEGERERKRERELETTCNKSPFNLLLYDTVPNFTKSFQKIRDNHGGINKKIHS